MKPPGPITEAFRISNYIEAAFWAIIGIALVIQAARAKDDARLACAIAGITLLAFGLSDIIETRTGAWWHPWWLLVWKGVCVIVLLWLVGRHVIASRRRP